MINIYFLNRKLSIIPTVSDYKYEEANTLICGSEEIKEFVLKFEDEKDYSLALIFSDEPKKILKEIKKNFKFIKAAGGIVRNSKEEILIIERLGKNDLPKGKVEKDEDVEVAAQREIAEECGITNLKLIGEFTPTYHTYWLKENFILKKTYWFNYNYSGNELPIPQTEEDITVVKWVNPEYLPIIKQNTYSSIIEVLDQVYL